MGLPACTRTPWGRGWRRARLAWRGGWGPVAPLAPQSLPFSAPRSPPRCVVWGRGGGEPVSFGCGRLCRPDDCRAPPRGNRRGAPGSWPGRTWAGPGPRCQPAGAGGQACRAVWPGRFSARAFPEAGEEAPAGPAVPGTGTGTACPSGAPGAQEAGPTRWAWVPGRRGLPGMRGSQCGTSDRAATHDAASPSPPPPKEDGSRTGHHRSHCPYGWDLLTHPLSRLGRAISGASEPGVAVCGERRPLPPRAPPPRRDPRAGRVRCPPSRRVRSLTRHFAF